MSMTHFCNPSAVGADGGGPPIPPPPGGLTFEESVTLAAPDNWWRLDETTGTIAVDSGSLLQDITYGVDAGTAGYDAESSLFDGTGQSKQLTLLTTPTRNLTSASGLSVGYVDADTYTIEFAVLMNAITGTNQEWLLGIFSPSARDQWSIQFHSESVPTKLTIRMYGANVTNINYDIVLDTDAFLAVWKYISVTYSTVTGNLDIRVDNGASFIIDASATGPLSIDPAPDGFGSNLRIGGDNSNNAADDYTIDEIQIYSRVLTSEERDSNYNAWATGGTAISSFESSVTALAPNNWFRLNESAGLVALDSGSVGVDGDYRQDAGTVGYDIAPSSAFTGAGSRAKQFDGSIDGIQQPLTATNGVDYPVFTIEFAWSPNTDQAGAGGVVMLEEAEVPNPFSANHWFFQQEDIGLRFRFWWDGGGFDENLSSIIALPAGYDIAQWNYVSLVFDFTTLKTINVRINDIETADIDITLEGPIGNSAGSGNEVITVGGDTSLINFADGGVDEVQKYLKALSSAERTRNYNFWKNGSP